MSKKSADQPAKKLSTEQLSGLEQLIRLRPAKELTRYVEQDTETANPWNTLDLLEGDCLTVLGILVGEVANPVTREWLYEVLDEIRSHIELPPRIQFELVRSVHQLQCVLHARLLIIEGDAPRAAFYACRAALLGSLAFDRNGRQIFGVSARAGKCETSDRIGGTAPQIVHEAVALSAAKWERLQADKGE